MEQTTTVKTPVLIYTEETPNPESLKFVTNRMLYRGTADFNDVETAREWTPLGDGLYDLPYVKGVYICNNFVTVTKEFNYNWHEIMMPLKEFVKKWLEDEKEIIKDGFTEAMAGKEAKEIQEAYTGDDIEIVKKIKELIDTYVKPAVEMDGGNIEFRSYNNGIVNVLLQGSCSGCPSSTVTLKAGIEGMLKRMVPQVTEVVSEMG